MPSELVLIKHMMVNAICCQHIVSVDCFPYVTILLGQRVIVFFITNLLNASLLLECSASTKSGVIGCINYLLLNCMFSINIVTILSIPFPCRNLQLLISLYCLLFRFYYYTAGSGGAGPTILSTSFLLLGEEVVAYNKGCP